MINKISVKAPGRINIIGEHTDYNLGLVLPAAINRYVQFDLEVSNSDISKIVALDIDETMEFDVGGKERRYIGWRAYVYGCFREIVQLGGKVKPVRGSFSGNIPVGSGLSSSAALEVALVTALNNLFDLKLTSTQLLNACHRADHHYVGVQSGIMDQFASLNGRKDHAIFIDCESGSYKYIKTDNKDYRFILINSMVTHEMANSEYNTRRNECLEALNLINKQQAEITSFRHFDLSILEKNKNILPGKLYNRMKHVVDENVRVVQSVVNLKNNDPTSLGMHLRESHYSLSKLYEVSCEELDFLADTASLTDGVYGSRMMGGGFGGCTINLIKSSEVKRSAEIICAKYKDRFSIIPECYILDIVDGALLAHD